VKLIVAGAGPAWSARPGSAGASYLVVQDGRAILLDLGQGAFPNVARSVEPSSILAVVVSHLHPDHFVDLVPLRHYLRYDCVPPRRVLVLAPAGIDRRLDDLHAEPGFTAASLDVEPLTAGIQRIGPFTVEAVRVTHTDDSFAFRIAPATPPDGPGLVYSGDCGDADDLRTIVRPGDALLAEASFGPGPVPVSASHLDGPAVGALAAAAGAGRVLLTHILDGYDVRATVASVRRTFDGPVEAVSPGDVIEV
jgi:ribonuclease BN (tRNA processing enzyme)